MRWRITGLVAATTSAVVLAFLVPLVLLVGTLAQDRALAGAGIEAQQVAVLVAGLGREELASVVDLVNEGSPRSTGVRLADGTTLGGPLPGAEDPGMARALDGESFTETGDGARVYVPVAGVGGTSVVRTAVTEADLRSGTGRAWTTLGVLGAFLLVASVLAADRMGRWVSTPVVELASVAHGLRAGDLGARAGLRGPPEVVELGLALNRLADRIAELLVAERESVADLSHRLRTPVTALRLEIDTVGDPVVGGRLRQHVDLLTRTIDAVMKDARRPVSSSVARRCDAAAVVSERVAFWSALAVDQGRLVEVDVAPSPLLASIEEEDLRDLLDALVDNVFAHTPEGTPFRVALSARGDGMLELVVADDGPGPPPGDVTERGRSGGGSTGLGLDIARRAALAAGGGLSVTRRAPHGTAVTVTLTAPTD